MNAFTNTGFFDVKASQPGQPQYSVILEMLMESQEDWQVRESFYWQRESGNVLKTIFYTEYDKILQKP